METSLVEEEENQASDNISNSGAMKPPSPLGEGLGVGLTTDEAFDTPPFTYSSDALNAIFTALSDDRGRIETSTLQIICRYVEDNLVGTEGADIRIEADDLGNIKAIFRQFYERTIARLPEAEQIPARRLVEDRLIKDGVRIPYAAQALLAEPDITQELLDALSAASLLRVQRDEQGRMLYEVGHDTLVAPITEAAQVRRAEEEQAAERELLRLESERQEAERKKIARARRRNIIFSAVALFLLLFAFWQNIEANRQKEEAEKQKAVAEERTATALAAETRAAEKDSLARKAQIEADTAQAIADRKTEEARLSAETTALAMIRLDHSTAQVVDALVREVNSHIYRLEYDAALGKLEAAARLNKTTPDFTHAALELAFYFNEAGESQANQLGQVLGLLGQARPRSREACSDYLQRSDPIWYKKLLGKYYPLMLPVDGGEFWMGCDRSLSENCSSDELPLHQVRLNKFKLARTETTVWQYNLYLAEQGNDIFDDKTISRPGWGWGG
ncbi:MAG: hypothetical protein IPM36_11370 [Lewinellaceae bacterium]|nr:hypothetical protein [Lewinellaceae bacterium]